MHRTRPALNPCPCVALTEKPESPVPAALCRLPAAEPDTKANVEAVEAGRRHSVALRWPGMTPSRFKSAYISRRSNRRRTWHRFCGSQIGPLGCSGGIAHGVGRVLQALHCLPGCLSNRQSSSIFRHRAPPSRDGHSEDEGLPRTWNRRSRTNRLEQRTWFIPR